MEQFQISKTDAGFHIEGFPDAVKFIRLDDPKARRISDLTLHKTDLEFAAACLTAINHVPVDPPVLRAALWRSAIVHYAKCFGNSASRSQLSDKKIYKNEPLGALEAFKFFTNLRNKHVVHDENAYMQSIPGAVLNKGDKPFKIEKILCFNVFFDVLVQENYNNLKLLIDKALAWVITEFDTHCMAVTKELEKQSYEELLKREAVVCRAPTIDDISKSRRSKP